MLCRSLVYPIRASVKIFNRPDKLQSLPLPPPLAEDVFDQSKRRRCRRSRRSSFGNNVLGKSSTAVAMPRLPVHQRLGPRVQSFEMAGSRVSRLSVHRQLGTIGIFNAEKGALKKMKSVWIPKRKLKSTASVWIPKSSSPIVPPLPVRVRLGPEEENYEQVIPSVLCQEVIPMDEGACLEASNSIVVTVDALVGSPPPVLCQEVIPKVHVWKLLILFVENDGKEVDRTEEQFVENDASRTEQDCHDTVSVGLWQMLWCLQPRREPYPLMIWLMMAVKMIEVWSKLSRRFLQRLIKNVMIQSLPGLWQMLWCLQPRR
jgi:hypothetical protein